jgi:hypothetical protein
MDSGEAVPGEAELAARAMAFAREVRGLNAMDDLAAAVDRAIRPLGLTAAASGLVSGPKAASPNPFHFHNWPENWLAHYVAEAFLLVDPIPRWARNSVSGVFAHPRGLLSGLRMPIFWLRVFDHIHVEMIKSIGSIRCMVGLWFTKVRGGGGAGRRKRRGGLSR